MTSNFLSVAQAFQNKLFNDIQGSFEYGDNIRKAYLDQADIPNQIAASDLGFLQKAYEIDDTRQNYQTNLETSRLSAINEREATAYQNRNLGRTFQLADLEAQQNFNDYEEGLANYEFNKANRKENQRLLILRRDSEILEKEGQIEQMTYDREASRLLGQVASDTGLGSYREDPATFWAAAFEASASTSLNTQSRIRGQFIEAFQPSVKKIQRLQDLEREFQKEAAVLQSQAGVGTEAQKATIKKKINALGTRYEFDLKHNLSQIDPRMLRIGLDQGLWSLEEIGAAGTGYTEAGISSLLYPDAEESISTEDVIPPEVEDDSSLIPDDGEGNVTLEDVDETPSTEETPDPYEGLDAADRILKIAREEIEKPVEGISPLQSEFTTLYENPEEIADIPKPKRSGIRTEIKKSNLALMKFRDGLESDAQKAIVDEFITQNDELADQLNQPVINEDGVPEDYADAVVEVPALEQSEGFMRAAEVSGLTELFNTELLTLDNFSDFEADFRRAFEAAYGPPNVDGNGNIVAGTQVELGYVSQLDAEAKAEFNSNFLRLKNMYQEFVETYPDELSTKQDIDFLVEKIKPQYAPEIRYR